MQKRKSNGNSALETRTACAKRGESSLQGRAESAEPLELRVQKLISQFISSVEQIEILCILMRDVGKRWSPEEILRIVQSSENSVIGCLQKLQKEGFLESEGLMFFYSPKDPELAQAASAMCNSYRERRVAVTEMIYRWADQR